MTLQAQIKWVTNMADFKREIESGTGMVVAHTEKVDKLVRSMSGTGLIGQVNNYVAAVEKMGGVEKLNAAEKDRINVLVTKAIEKYELLGQTAPPHLQRLAEQTRNATKDTEAMQSKLDGFASGARSAGTALSIGLTAPIVAAGGWIAKLGMDAVESENLVSVSFGDMKGAADAWAAGLSKNLGLNRFETEKMAGTLFNMTTGMGIARDKAFEMSTGVVKLAADMASFRNIPMEEALLKIRSGLTGEAEPLKAIGILVDDATIKTYAYANGIARQGTELTQQQKVMARYGAILQQTANDQGDLARTLDSPANQLRIMRSRIDETATSLGISLLPMIQQVIGGAADLVPYIQTAVEWFVKLPDPVKYGALALLAVAAAAGPVLLVAGGMASAISALLPLMGGMAGASAAITTGLGVALPVVAAFGVAILAWKIGRAIADVLELDEKIAGLAVRLGLIGDVKAEAAAAKMNTLALATQHAGHTITDYSEAIKINEKWVIDHTKATTASTTAADAQADQYKKLKAEAQALVKDAVTPLTTQQRELVLMFDKGGESAKNIATKLNVSEEAVKLLTDAHKKAVTAGTEHAKALEDIRKASIPLTFAQRDVAIANDKLGVSAEKTAKALGVNADAVSGYLDSLKAAKDIAATWEKAHETMLSASKKFINKWVDDSQAAARKVADASGKALADRILAADEYHEKSYQQTLDATARNVRQIEVERDAKIRAVGDMNGEVSRYYAHQIDLANYAGLHAAWQAEEDHQKRAKIGYGDLSKALSNMATVAGPALGTVVRGLATIVTTLETAKASQKQFGEGMTEFKDPDGSKASGLLSMSAGVMGIASSALAAGKALKDMWNHFFGTAGRDAVKEFAASFGGFDDMHARLLTLGAAGEALWVKLTQGVGRNNPQQAAAVIAEINAALAGQDAWMQRLPGLIEKYGLSWEQAGQQAKQAHLDEIAQGLIKDFADLSRAGFDVTLITEKMSASINDYVHLAMQTGTEIPAAMRPLLQKMIEMGTLTDLAGAKMTDLEGLSFAETLTAGFKSIVDAIKELTRALGGLPGHVLIDVEERHRRTGVDADADPTRAEPFHNGTARVLPFPIVAHNGLLPDEVPAILQTGEAVLNRRAAAAVGTQTIGALNRGDRPARGGDARVDELRRELAAQRASSDANFDRLLAALPKMVKAAAQQGKAA